MRRVVLTVAASLTLLSLSSSASAGKPDWAGQCFGQSIREGPNAVGMTWFLDLYRALLSQFGNEC